jgi:LmbE family N-acetylglucosaminyl deacetylase
MGAPESNHYEDVTEMLSDKLAALQAHESQTAHMEDLEGRIRTWMSAIAIEAGFAPDALAESFRVVNTA